MNLLSRKINIGVLACTMGAVDNLPVLLGRYLSETFPTPVDDPEDPSAGTPTTCESMRGSDYRVPLT